MRNARAISAMADGTYPATPLAPGAHALFRVTYGMVSGDSFTIIGPAGSFDWAVVAYDVAAAGYGQANYPAYPPAFVPCDSAISPQMQLSGTSAAGQAQIWAIYDTSAVTATIRQSTTAQVPELGHPRRRIGSWVDGLRPVGTRVREGVQLSLAFTTVTLSSGVSFSITVADSAGNTFAEVEIGNDQTGYGSLSVPYPDDGVQTTGQFNLTVTGSFTSLIGPMAAVVGYRQ